MAETINGGKAPTRGASDAGGDRTTHVPQHACAPCLHDLGVGAYAAEKGDDAEVVALWQIRGRARGRAHYTALSGHDHAHRRRSGSRLHRRSRGSSRTNPVGSANARSMAPRCPRRAGERDHPRDQHRGDQDADKGGGNASSPAMPRSPAPGSNPCRHVLDHDLVRAAPHSGHAASGSRPDSS